MKKIGKKTNTATIKLPKKVNVKTITNYAAWF